MNSTSLSQVLLNPPGQLRHNGGAAELSGNSASFAKYLQKKADQQQARQDQLGTSEKAAADKDREDIEQDRAEKKKAANQNAAAFLLTILNDIKKMAQEGTGTDGAFVLQGIDRQQFEALLQSMGLGADEAGSFGQFLTKAESSLRLEDFLTMLASRLEKLTKDQPVSIQETELPFIQSLLDRFGVSAGQSKGATDPAVTGDNHLDLQILVAGLKELQKATPQGDAATTTSAIALSERDLEQLQNIISEAGLADENQQAMLRTLLQKSGALATSRSQ